MIPAAEVAGVPLDVKGGRITLDAGQAPHVEGTLTIGIPDAGTLDLLDPRVTPRVQVTCVGRVFDLGIRDRDAGQGDAEVVLTLASDEALLADYAPLADLDLIGIAGDLGAVLERVILEATGDTVAVGGATADVSPYWAVTNMIPNPSIEVDASNWIAGTGASALTRIAMASPPAPSGTYALRWTAAAGISNVIPGNATNNYPVTPGKWYVFSAYIASNVARFAQPVIQWWTSNGTVLASQVQGSTISTTPAEFRRVTVVAQAPPGATHGLPYVLTNGNVAGNLHFIDNAMFYEGFDVVPYFDGTTPDDDHYTYDWAGTPHASASSRTPYPIERARDAVIWKAGQTGLEFIVNLAQAVGLRPVCDEQRAWTLRDETYTAPGAISVRYGVNLIDGTDVISRDQRVWFDAAARVYRWRDRDGIEHEQVDTYALTDPYTLMSTIEINAAYPGPGRAEYAVRRAQNRGREVTATAVADWDAACEQQITVTIPGAPTQYGKVQSVQFSLDDNEMTVNTSTTDIDADAWVLQDPDDPWTINSPDQTWLEAAS